jgi:hypothetical protein
MSEFSGANTGLTRSEERITLSYINPKQQTRRCPSICTVPDNANRLLLEGSGEDRVLGNYGGGTSEGDMRRALRWDLSRRENPLEVL